MRVFLHWGLVLVCGVLVACAAPSSDVLIPPATITPLPQAQVTPLPSPTVAPVPPPVFPVLFASDTSGVGQLYILVNGEQRHIPLPADVESAWQPALSADGSRILFTGRRNGQSDIALTPLEGGKVTWLTDVPADDFSPAWSWDGEQIAFVSEREEQAHIWLQPLEGTPQRIPSVFENKPTRNPTWLPDGTLLYSALNADSQELLYRYDPATHSTTPQTEFPYKASQSAVNANNEIAFVGWVENPPWRGIYRLSGTNAPTLLWETKEWIGEPAWSADGAWILFTRAARDGTGHDIWALSAAGGDPVRVTSGAAWETDAVALAAPAGAIPPYPETAPLQAASQPLIGGFNVANLDNAYLSKEVGFGWAKGFAFWERIEPEPGVYDWRDVDNTVHRYEEAGLQIFLRVDRTPTWARPPDTIGSHPPTDMEAYARFLETLAARYKGRVAVYELWNEPNLSYEWGNKFPDPAYYVEMLRVARPALLRGDPDAKLVVGALAVTSTSDQSMDDLEWMDKFYQALGPNDGTLYDAFSTHPYGFAQPPDFPPEQGLGLRRLEAHRAIMLQYGDTVPLWLTELGYPRQAPAWDLGSHHQWMVSDALQGQYIADTVTYVHNTYPFVEAVFFFNLDFSTADWYISGEQMRAFAILDSTGRPLPAFTALRKMVTLP